MQARRELPDKPRFQYAIDRAYSILLEIGVDRFPVSPWEVIEQWPEHIKCLSWSRAREVLNTEDPFHLHQTKAEARTLCRRDHGNVYMIIYDDVNVTNQERIRWTLMHELGHIFCRHLIDFEETALDRGGLSNGENSVLEVEAHFFASEMLVPSAVFHRFSDVAPEEIRLLCGISEEASKKAYNRLYQNDYYKATSKDDAVFRNFWASMHNHLGQMMYSGIARIWGKKGYTRYLQYCRKCHKCKSFNMDKDAKYCIYCGEPLEVSLSDMSVSEWNWAERSQLHEEGFDHFRFPLRTNVQMTDSKPGIAYCPICMNEEFSSNAHYCRVCGHPLYNVCLGENKLVSYEAQFCPDCGCETSFHRGYQMAEQRVKKFQDTAFLCRYSEDWEEYRFWDFVKLCITNKTPTSLTSAILYSRAFIDDDERLIVYVLSEKAAIVVRSYESAIIEQANEANPEGITSMEVYSIE